MRESDPKYDTKLSTHETSYVRALDGSNSKGMSPFRTMERRQKAHFTLYFVAKRRRINAEPSQSGQRGYHGTGKVRRREIKFDSTEAYNQEIQCRCSNFSTVTTCDYCQTASLSSLIRERSFISALNQCHFCNSQLPTGLNTP